jgi:valyl-tRNA synthetase
LQVKQVYQIFKDRGYILRKELIVKVESIFGCIVSSAEIKTRNVKKKLYYIRYYVGNESLVVATTRPETIFSDVALVVHPSDQRYIGLIGQLAYLPELGLNFPIHACSKVYPDFGSGVVKVTPRYDQRD